MRKLYDKYNCFIRKKYPEEQKNINSGRIAQKMKTRERLLIAANTMMIEGEEISVELVAKKADVSKATAYCYFSNKEILLTQQIGLQFRTKL